MKPKCFEGCLVTELIVWITSSHLPKNCVNYVLYLSYIRPHFGCIHTFRQVVNKCSSSLFDFHWHICPTLVYQQSHKVCFVVQLFIGMFSFASAVILMKYSKLSWSRRSQWHLCASFDDLPLPGFSEFSFILTLSLCSIIVNEVWEIVLLCQRIMSYGSTPAKKKQNPQTVMSHTLWPLKGHSWVISWWCLTSKLPVVAVAW